MTISERGSIDAYIEPLLGQRETLKKYTFSSKIGVPSQTEAQALLGEWLKAIPAMLVAWLIGSPNIDIQGSSSDKVGTTTLLVLTDQRLIYSKVEQNLSGLTTWISPNNTGDGPASVPLSEIKWAYYQKGTFNGKLTVRLQDDSPREFFFNKMHFGGLAQEIAELINVGKVKPE